MADAYSIPDGLGVVAVLLAVSYAVDWLSFRSRFVHDLMHPKPILLIRDGVVLEDALKRELLTMERLHCKLRGHGLTDTELVAEAWLEGDGQVSVIRREDGKSRSSLSENVSAAVGRDSIACNDDKSLDQADLWELARRLEQGLRHNKKTFGPI